MGLIMNKELTLLYGALTINDYKFRGRAWEIDTQSIYDVLSDELVNVQIRDNEVLRVLPFKGGGWISDFSRFYYPLYRFEDLRKTVVYEKRLGAWWLTSLNIEWLFWRFSSSFQVGACLQNVLEELVDTTESEHFTGQFGRFSPIGIPSYVLWMDNIRRLCGLGLGALCYNPLYNSLRRFDLVGEHGFINEYCRQFTNTVSVLQFGLKVLVRCGLMGLRERSVGVIERMSAGLNINEFFNKDCGLVFNWQDRVSVEVNALNSISGVDTAVGGGGINRLLLVLYENGSQPLQLGNTASRSGLLGLYRGEFLERREFVWNVGFEGILQDYIIQKPYEFFPPVFIRNGILELVQYGTLKLQL